MMPETEKNNSICELIAIMAKLRGPDGCPWDRKQTFQTLKLYLAEECAELIDAIDDENIHGICEEAGDLLLHIVFLSQIAEENEQFDFNDVIECINKKMWRRHPHIFGEQSADTPEQVVELWEKIKKQEKGKTHQSVMEGIPRHLSPLLQARKVQKKAARYGFDWNNESQIVEKIEEELDELKTALKNDSDERIEEEIGDLLFSVVNLSRFRNKRNAEELLRKTVKKFRTRFEYIETQLLKNGKKLEDSSIGEMETLWQKSKTIT